MQLMAIGLVLSAEQSSYIYIFFSARPQSFALQTQLAAKRLDTKVSLKLLLREANAAEIF